MRMIWTCIAVIMMMCLAMTGFAQEAAMVVADPSALGEIFKELSTIGSAGALGAVFVVVKIIMIVVNKTDWADVVVGKWKIALSAVLTVIGTALAAAVEGKFGWGVLTDATFLTFLQIAVHEILKAKKIK